MTDLTGSPLPQPWRWATGSVADEDVLDLLRSSAHAELAGVDIAPELLDALAQQQAVARLAGHRSSHPNALEAYVLGADGRVAGRLVLTDTLRGWHLVDLVVLPSARGGGLGSAMVGSVTGLADSRGRAVRLRVARLSPAVHLYLRTGFTVEDADEFNLLLVRTAGPGSSDSVPI